MTNGKMAKWRGCKEEPTKPGWYAAFLCWDREEGEMPDAVEWESGSKWSDFTDPYYIWYEDPFETEELAYEFADRTWDAMHSK